MERKEEPDRRVGASPDRAAPGRPGPGTAPPGGRRPLLGTFARGGSLPQIRRVFGLAGLLFGAWFGWEIGRLLSLFAGILCTLVTAGVGWSVARRYAERNY